MIMVSAFFFGIAFLGETFAQTESIPAQTNYTLTTPAGRFAFGGQCTSSCPPIERVVHFNGTRIPSVAGLCLVVPFGIPNPYLMDAFGEWTQWNGTTFVPTSNPGIISCATSPYSPDGTVLVAPTDGSITDPSGVWTFGTIGDGNGNYSALLDGVQQDGGTAAGIQYLVANDGNLYLQNTSEDWYQWNPNLNPPSFVDLHTTTTP